MGLEADRRQQQRKELLMKFDRSPEQYVSRARVGINIQYSIHSAS